ncbi:MAG: endonuclease III [Acidimicrobiales bacterium]
MARGTSAQRALKARAASVLSRLRAEYPGTARELCALEFEDPFQLLVATILSAQSTDVRVNSVTPALFGRYPTAADLAGADPAEVEAIIFSTGFFRSKAKNLVAMAGQIAQRFASEVPSEMEELVGLPGVGRKTANVVRSVAFGLPGLPVDTHVGRLARRLGLARSDDPVAVERELCALVDEAELGALSLRLILHGRAVCTARRPKCETCILADICPSAELPVSSRVKGSKTTWRQ